MRGHPSKTVRDREAPGPIWLVVFQAVIGWLNSTRPPLRVVDRKRCSLREQLGNSRTQSWRVMTCRSVFTREV